MQDIYYFVVCEHRSGDMKTVANVIIKNTHPLIWAAEPPVVFKKFFTTRILFWTEIPEAVAQDEHVRAYFSRSNE